MARLQDVVFDSHHPASLARFWAAALDAYSVAPYDDAELERLRSMGVDDPEDDPTVMIEAPGLVPRLWFQRVPEAKVVKNRVHLDLVADSREAVLEEVARLSALGATVLRDPQEEFGQYRATLQDPEGNEFCIGTTWGWSTCR